MTPSPRRLALALALVVAAAWTPALRGGFVWDDQHDIVRSDRLHHWRALADVFRHHAMWSADAPETAVATYRPLALASLALDYQLWGLTPLGFHLTSLFLHVLATLALFLALRPLLRADLSAAVLALLFALHPADAEAVAWINGRSEVLALGCGALALWAASARRWLAMAPALTAAMLSKETGALFVPLALVVGWLEFRNDGSEIRERLRPSWPPVAAALLPLVAYAAARRGALGPSALPPGGAGEALRALPALWLRATQAALLPIERAPVTLSTWLRALSLVARIGYAIAAAGFIAIGAVLLARRRLVAAIGLGWWLLAIAPTTAIAILDYPWPGLARWLYVGLPGLLVCIYCAAAQRLLGARAQLWLATAIAALWLTGLERAIVVWRSDTRLYATMVDESPGDAWAWRALGINQLGLGHYADAAPLFHHAAEIDRTEEVHAAYALEAFTWTYLDRCDEAVAQFRAHPPTPAVDVDLFTEGAAACYARAGHLPRARQLYASCAKTREGCQRGLASLSHSETPATQSR
jgi:tetratricopeptide (TPR) repeat protein